MQWAVRAIGWARWQPCVVPARHGYKQHLHPGPGLRVPTNGFGLMTAFGSTFYTLTGFHGAHVQAGPGFHGDRGHARKGLISVGAAAVEVASYYWYFRMAWIFLFSTCRPLDRVQGRTASRAAVNSSGMPSPRTSRDLATRRPRGHGSAAGPIRPPRAPTSDSWSRRPPAGSDRPYLQQVWLHE